MATEWKSLIDQSRSEDILQGVEPHSVLLYDKNLSLFAFEGILWLIIGGHHRGAHEEAEGAKFIPHVNLRSSPYHDGNACTRLWP